MTRWIGAFALVLLGLASLRSQDVTECAKFNACHKEHGKEKIDCPQCSKAKIPSEDKACSACSSKAKICKHCGLPKKGAGGSKPAGGGTIQDAVQLVTVADMKEILAIIAADDMEGRQTGTAGIKKAREYIIKRLKEFGAKSLASDGSYTLPWGNCANIGVLHEGSDPKLKGEYVIIGSHYDHIGMRSGGGGGDNINNGADDNGSGTTTNLTICKAICKSGFRPKRSIIQLWFSGEEIGLRGSAAYCQNPAIPHGQCVMMLNCDMLGRNPERPATLYGVGSSTQFKPIVDKALAAVPNHGIKPMMEKGQYFMRSDQVNFWNAGVPVMFLCCGEHPDYHKPTDHADRIAYDRMQGLGRGALAILLEASNWPERPAKDPNYK
jgi:hypothetical protein